MNRYQLSEAHVLGDSKYTLVRSDNSDQRPWLAKSPICPLLQQHNMAHVEIFWANHPFEVTRVALSGTYMLACFEGQGQVLVDGVWRTLKAGQACLQPPFMLNALKCVKKSAWGFCGVRYLESKKSVPIISEKSPVLGEFDYAPLKAAITGLHAEAIGSNVPSALSKWIELIQHYVLQFAQPHHFDQRLWSLWTKIEQKLDHKWTLYELALLAHLSEEHLRRLCRKHHGRSPMQHVTFLRMRRAMELLGSTDQKIEAIARSVGYESPYSFSNVFHQWVRLRPSECR